MSDEITPITGDMVFRLSIGAGYVDSDINSKVEALYEIIGWANNQLEELGEINNEEIRG
jgi:hypothetical protein